MAKKEPTDTMQSFAESEDRLSDSIVLSMENELAGFKGCLNCKHLFSDEISCKAFPNVIPSDILTNEFDHRVPWEGDNGILFEPKD